MIANTGDETMAQCKRCGTKGLFSFVDENGLCSKCREAERTANIAAAQEFYDGLVAVYRRMCEFRGTKCQDDIAAAMACGAELRALLDKMPYVEEFQTVFFKHASMDECRCHSDDFGSFPVNKISGKTEIDMSRLYSESHACEYYVAQKAYDSFVQLYKEFCLPTPETSDALKHTVLICEQILDILNAHSSDPLFCSHIISKSSDPNLDYGIVCPSAVSDPCEIDFSRLIARVERKKQLTLGRIHTIETAVEPGPLEVQREEKSSMGISPGQSPDFDFLAIDFETARARMDSACSVGIVAVKNLEIVDTAYSLLRPPTLDFDPRNISIHGITPDLVERAPTLDEFWTEISWMFSQHCPVLAHNVRFDMSVLRHSTSAEIPNFPYIDSMNIAAPLVTGSRSLSHCAEVLGIDMGTHHNALDDAMTCAHIAIHGLESAGCVSMWEYLAQTPMNIHRFADLTPQQSAPASKSPKPRFQHTVKPSEVVPQPDSVFDSKHPLYQKNIVFTGDLTISRKRAMQMAVDVGAVVKSGVSRCTDYLVVGQQDPSLVGEDGLSSKQEKALELNRSGCGHIVTLDESEFLSLVGEN